MTWHLPCRPALIGFSAAMLLSLFSPALVNIYWHLRYGYSTVYRGKKIPVPYGWIVNESLPQGLHLARLPSTVLGLKNVPSTLSISQSGAQKIPIEEAYRSFKLAYWTYQGDLGVVSGPLRFGEAENEAFCMKSTSKGPNGLTSVDCQLFRGSWLAIYLGREKDVDAVFQIIRGAQ